METADNIRNGLNDAVSGFTQRSNGVGGNGEFLSTNGMVAKIAFVLAVLVVFILLLKVGLYAVTWLLSPAKSPYVVYGLLSGTRGITVSNADVEILRSNNEDTGMEFTWALWLFIDSNPTYASGDSNPYQHVFSKGISQTATTLTKQKISTDLKSTSYLDAPGLYIKTDKKNSDDGYQQAYLVVRMSKNVTSASESGTNLYEEIEVNNIPIRRWIHVAIRMQNTIMDVYVNGTIVSRKVFSSAVPIQSYGHVYIAQNGGFGGKLSNLRYYDHALSVFGIQQSVWWGPNLSSSSYERTAAGSGQSNFFFANDWYSARY